MLQYGRKIMIVEDDMSTLSVIYHTLLQQDYVLEASSDAAEVQQRAERFLPELVLLSDRMIAAPDNNLFAYLKDTFNVPVIILTSNKRKALLFENETAAENFLYKPVNTAALVQKIKVMLLT